MGLYDYAKSTNRSIGNLEMQLEFLWIELQNYIKQLAAATNVREASDIIMLKFEKPSDQSEQN